MVYGTDDTVSAEGVSACSGDGGICERQSANAVGAVQAKLETGRPADTTYLL